jgi:hypothetical protein
VPKSITEHQKNDIVKDNKVTKKKIKELFVKMMKYKSGRFCKSLLKLWLFYYFLNTIKVHNCQINDVEFISLPQNNVNDVSDVQETDIDSEPIDSIDNINQRFNFDDDIDERKNVNLNVNNNLHDTEKTPQFSDDESLKFTEIRDYQITGEKTLYLSESPYLVRQDIEVFKNARLNVEAGVKIHFAPMVGITVHGQMKAIVSINYLFIFIST